MLLFLAVAGCASQPRPGSPHELYNRLLNVRCLAFDPTGALLVGGRNKASEGGGDLLIWDLLRQPSMRELPAHPDSLVSLGFGPQGLMTAGYEGSVLSWDTVSWTSQPLLQLPRWLSCARFSAQEPVVAVLRASGKSTFQPQRAQLLLHNEKLQGSAVQFEVPGAIDVALSPDGGRLAALMSDGKVKFWSPQGTAGAQLEGQATCLAFSPDGKQLAVGNQQGIVTLWDSLSAGSNTALPSLGQPIRALCFSPDGRRLAYSYEGHLLLSEQGKVVWDRPVDSYATPLVIAFSPDGRRLATAGASKVLLWSDL